MAGGHEVGDSFSDLPHAKPFLGGGSKCVNASRPGGKFRAALRILASPYISLLLLETAPTPKAMVKRMFKQVGRLGEI